MRLLTLDNSDIPNFLRSLEKESRALVDQINEICWYMRGGITRDQAWTLSPLERKRVMKLIEKNIERTNKTGLPLL